MLKIAARTTTFQKPGKGAFYDPPARRNLEGPVVGFLDDLPPPVSSAHSAKDSPLYPPSTHDQGLAMTSSYSSMVVAAQALAHLDRMAAFREQVDRTAQAGEYVLHTYPDRIRERVGRDISRAFFLGNNDLFGTHRDAPSYC